MNYFKIFLLLLLAGFTASCGSATSYTIEGDIKGIPEGATVLLISAATHSDAKPVAEAVVTNGKFTFTGECNEPRMFYIRVDDSYGNIKLMVENADISLKGEAISSDMNGAKRYDMSGVKVKGSKSHKLYLQKSSPREPLDDLYAKYHDDNKEISEAIGQARMNGDTELLDSLNNTEEAKKLAEDEKNFFNTVEETITKIVMDNKDSWWGPLLMLDQFSYFTDEYKQWYSEFSQEAQESHYGQILKEALFPKGFIGQSLPAFALNNETHGKTDIATVSANKKYILVDFWASWCGPCRKEIPNLKNLYEKYSSKGFEIIGISIDKNRDDWAAALESERLPWPNFLDTLGASDSCNVMAVPAMFLLDSDGIVIAEKIRGEELEQKLYELLQ